MSTKDNCRSISCLKSDDYLSSYNSQIDSLLLMNDDDVSEEIMCILNHHPCFHLVQVLGNDIIDIHQDLSQYIFSETPKIQTSQKPPPFNIFNN
ncbi:hypothetical protein KM1_234810 [Entamoeba histolytica HM-3:IMSS]|uniref:Uncharacterized protein n=1 Tax=Entamoeba histolytica HM-3:IMSS TaxID=885315 RepID=M7WSW2_ENTHI|nr:hypothetical protein KM1_234810 [Entamoeba histolytica HM-3:IMSS]